MKKRVAAAALVLALVGVASCSSSPDQGTEGGACFPNGTCNAGLTCLSNLCVKETPAEGGIDSGGADAAADVSTSDVSTSACTDPTSGTAARFAANAVTLPMQASDDAFDLDGVPPQDGTTVPGVRRELKAEASAAVVSHPNAGEPR